MVAKRAGLFLTDITFIDAGNAPWLDNGLINIDKHRKLAVVLQEMLRFQAVPYRLQIVASIQESLLSREFLDEHELYKISTSMEARQSV